MITPFDKNGVAERFKREFAERLNDDDYEGAIDYLIKYSEERDNPHFHLAMGMLYLLMTQDSDDSELIYMAYREFMLQIRRDPSCTFAYRNLLATEFLRRDLPDVAKYAAWFDRRGIDAKLIMDELEAADFFIPFSTEPLDFDYFFGEGEFGEIDPNYDPTVMLAKSKSVPSYDYYELVAMNKDKINALVKAYEATDRVSDLVQTLNGVDDGVKRSNRIIKFGGGNEAHAKAQASDTNKVLSFSDKPNSDDGGEGSIFDQEFLEENDELRAALLEKFIESLKIGSDDDQTLGEVTIDGDGAEIEVQVRGIFDANRLMHLAENKYDTKDYDAALELLEKISRGSGNYYYVLAMRALIYLEKNDIENGESAINEALEIKPDGALVGTLLCRLYELKEQYDKIPQALKCIDIADFTDGDHVYRTVFKYVLKYCNEDDALELIDELIEEYNILDVRLVYAQMMYNRGEKEYALKELYTLSRIFYDDINIRYFYLAAKTGVKRLPVDNEAPQEVLTLTVNTVIEAVESGVAFSDTDPSSVEIFNYCLEFFISLEFRNAPRVLKKMFEVVKKLSKSKEFEQKMRDALVSPYVEPIVKAVILSELFIKDPKTEFVAEVMYEPISSECLKTLDGKYTSGYYIAYAFTAILCPSAVDKLIEDAKSLKANGDADQNAIAYRLFTRATKTEKVDDDRMAYAMGFGSRAAAARAVKALVGAADAQK